MTRRLCVISFCLFTLSLVLCHEIAPTPLLERLAVSAVVAFIAVRGFIHYLTRHGLAAFGWYRVAFGAIVLYWLGTGAL